MIRTWLQIKQNYMTNYAKVLYKKKCQSWNDMENKSNYRNQKYSSKYKLY